MSDLISRKSAIEALRRAEALTRAFGYHNVIDTIREIPSAQPDIVRCKGCRNWDTTWTNDWAPNYHYCPVVDGVRNGDWFCADAERRTDE